MQSRNLSFDTLALEKDQLLKHTADTLQKHTNSRINRGNNVKFSSHCSALLHLVHFLGTEVIKDRCYFESVIARENSTTASLHECILWSYYDVLHRTKIAAEMVTELVSGHSGPTNLLK